MGVLGNLWSYPKEVQLLVVYDVELGIVLEPMQGRRVSSQVDLAYTELFLIPVVTSVYSRFVTVFLGTLWSSMKQIKAPYVFDWEHGIALHAMQGNLTSSLCDGKVSWFF